MTDASDQGKQRHERCKATVPTPRGPFRGLIRLPIPAGEHALL